MLTIRDSAEDRRKARFEQNITSAFLLVYNRARGTAFSIVRAGTPPELDLVCQDAKSSSSMGVEVVTVYYDETHAKSVWEQARGNQMSPYFIAKTDDIENRRVLARGLREIKKKSKKEYKRLDRTLLLVQVYPCVSTYLMFGKYWKLFNYHCHIPLMKYTSRHNMRYMNFFLIDDGFSLNKLGPMESVLDFTLGARRRLAGK